MDTTNRNEQLVHLPDGMIDDDIPSEPREETDPLKDTAPIKSQWQVLKLIEETKSKGLALRELCQKYGITDLQSEAIQEPLGRLLRARRIKATMGISGNQPTRAHTGVFYVSCKYHDETDITKRRRSSHR